MRAETGRVAAACRDRPPDAPCRSHSYGRRDEMAAGRQMLHPDERVRSADEAVAAARELRGKELIVTVAREVAVQQDAPGLRIDVLVAQRRERDPHLERPAARGDLRRRFPEEIRRRILARRIVGDRVVLDVARRDDEERGGAAGVARVDDDAAVVVEAVADVVAVGERRANRARRGVVELEARVKKLVVVRQIPDVVDLRLHVVADVGFVPLAHRRRRLPHRLGQVAVDRDVIGRPRDGQGRARQRRLRGADAARCYQKIVMAAGTGHPPGGASQVR